jgi:hypothetical protein
METQTSTASKSEGSIEQRSSPRKSVNIPCSLRIFDSVLTGRILDLSTGGVFVEFNDPPAFGTEISLRFRVTGRGKSVDLDLQGVVVYAGRFLQGFENFYGFGVQFHNIGNTTTAILEEAMQQMEPEPERKYGLD